ncbi:MAG: putative para-aminobenzoate synthase component [Frankiales bacterium]|nr:putative para-aminobenzoate synthase component [Frankiales bacterium]
MSTRSGNWRHKWNDRRYLAELENALAGEDARADAMALPLFISAAADSRRAQFYETSRSNVLFVPAVGVLVTPPLSDQVLPGVSRRRLLDAALDHRWRVEIRPAAVSELLRARLVLSVNALSITGVADLDGQLLTADQDLLGLFRGWLPEFADLDVSQLGRRLPD